MCIRDSFALFICSSRNKPPASACPTHTLGRHATPPLPDLAARARAGRSRETRAPLLFFSPRAFQAGSDSPTLFRVL
eukprot:1487612-Alexandrium_andersonii.AAC.1